MVRIFDMSAGEEQLDLSEHTMSVAAQLQCPADLQPQCQLRLLTVAESEEQRVPRPRPWLF